MKNINKIIHWKMIEISFLLSVIMISFPIWKTLAKSEALSIAASYSDIQFSHLEITNTSNGAMFPISNEKALKNIKPGSIKVINDTKTKEDYVNARKISKLYIWNSKANCNLIIAIFLKKLDTFVK